MRVLPATYRKAITDLPLGAEIVSVKYIKNNSINRSSDRKNRYDVEVIYRFMGDTFRTTRSSHCHRNKGKL